MALGATQGTTQSRRGAISNDGSRVIWESAATKALYMRDLARDETIQLDAVQGGSGEDQTAPRFQLASPDGSRVLFTDTQRLTSGSGKTVEVSTDLYECEMEEEAGKLNVQAERPDATGSRRRRRGRARRRNRRGN